MISRELRASIEHWLVSSFEMTELRTLVTYALDVSIDELSGGEKSEKVYMVVDYAVRNDKIGALLAESLRMKPADRDLVVILRSMLDGSGVGLHGEAPRKGANMDNQLEQLYEMRGQMGELRGQLIALQREITLLRSDMDRLSHSLVTITTPKPQTLDKAVIVAAIVMGLVFGTSLLVQYLSQFIR